MGLFDEMKQTASNIYEGANLFLKDYGFDSALSLLTGASTSDWQGLNSNLLATFYPVTSVAGAEKRTYVRDYTGGSVVAPILDGAEMEYTFNWQSPFEQMGTEAKAPALTAMLQSGVLSQAYAGFMSKTIGDQASETAKSTNQTVGQALESMVGRTGITKLNSTQVFSGMSPVKCSMKLLFRAYSDPKSEVMNPIQKLLSWAVPQKLSEDSSLVIMAKEAASGNRNVADYISALLPSYSPTMIGMEYKGRTYMPMVIETISDPITSPTTSSGEYASAEVSLTIASLTAWDKGDINQIYGSGSVMGLVSGLMR